RKRFLNPKGHATRTTHWEDPRKRQQGMGSPCSSNQSLASGGHVTPGHITPAQSPVQHMHVQSPQPAQSPQLIPCYKPELVKSLTYPFIRNTIPVKVGIPIRNPGPVPDKPELVKSLTYPFIRNTIPIKVGIPIRNPGPVPD
ncbi:unnamed protein product, partial [Notodromas monacha]